MNPYINHMAGFGAGFVGFYPVEASAATGSGGFFGGFNRFGRLG